MEIKVVNWRLFMRKNMLAIMMAMILLFQNFYISYGATDLSILSDPISNVYTARAIGSSLLQNITFKDMSSHWAEEPVARLGALEIVKGYIDGRYQPGASVSKEEALAILLRVVGQEQAAIQAAQLIATQNPTNDALRNLWSKGYLQIARNLGLITTANYNDALVTDQTTLDPAVNFMRSAAVTREQMAKWMVQAIMVNNPTGIAPVYTQQAIFNYTDWADMGVDFTPYIEAVITNQIMVGSGNTFLPKKSLTRAELAQMIENMDNILYATMNIEKKVGIVGSVQDNSAVNTLTGIATRSFLIRNSEGKVDQLNFEYKKNTLGQTATKDAPVYQEGVLKGMMSLREGDYIEYLVKTDTKELLYVNGTDSAGPTLVRGILQPLTGLSKGEITIKTEAGVLFTYQMRTGLYDPINQTIKLGQGNYNSTQAPVSHHITLTLQNALVTDIQYDGDLPLYLEVSGLVKAINPSFSYITIIDWNGKEVTKYYKKGSIQIEKQNYYDETDEIGYIDEMFPDYNFDERDSSIDQIEPGDIVHLRLDPKNTDYVSMISAKTNYIVRYGTIKEVSYKGAEGAKIIITYDDQSLGVFDISAEIPILKADKNVGISSLVSGDVVRMLINQAVLEPGTVSETIKEIIIDGYGNTVAHIYKGQLGKIDLVQRKISLLGAYQLSNIGWKDFSAAKSLDISATNVAYYKDNQQISLAYAEKYLTQSDMQVYVVTSNYYGLEKVAKVAIRSGRDSVLDFSNVTYSNGFDQMKILSQSGDITMDEGTIVIKNGKLVQVGNVLSPDYAQVILNGNSQAAIVSIQQEPNNEAVSVMRGRVQTIEEGVSFKVLSHAVLMDMKWVYSPIPRVYNLTKDTMIYDEEGIIPFEDFIDYSDISKVDEVYTIVAEGTDAKMIVKNPYAEEGVKGQIYKTDTDILMIKDALVYSSTDNKWTTLSLTNNYAQINLFANSVIIKNNQVITQDELVVGDKIRVMATENLADKLLLKSERDVDGYIIFVER